MARPRTFICPVCGKRKFQQGSGITNGIRHCADHTGKELRTAIDKILAEKDKK